MSSILQSHLLLAHHFWKEHLQPGNTALDATCGNGKDSYLLAKLVLTPSSGELVCLDLQKVAIDKTQELLQSSLPHELHSRISYLHLSHDEYHPENKEFNLIVYNLGYLPGSDKSLITRPESTTKSLENLLPHLASEGMISITCYPGHQGGEIEEELVYAWAKQLNPLLYVTCSHKWLNRNKAPSLLFIKKKN